MTESAETTRSSNVFWGGSGACVDSLVVSAGREVAALWSGVCAADGVAEPLGHELVNVGGAFFVATPEDVPDFAARRPLSGTAAD